MKKNELKIEYIDIEKLKPYEKNAKLHTKVQIDQIKSSIEQFGMNDPIAVWGGNNLIVEGHGRLIACKELGMKEVPIIRLDSLTDEQRRAYTLIHNQTTMNTGFDIDILSEELNSIIDIDMTEFDFNFDFNLDEFDVDDKKEKEENTKEIEDETVVYELVFNNSNERKTWYDFLRKLKEKYPDVDTISERLIKAIEEFEWED